MLHNTNMKIDEYDAMLAWINAMYCITILLGSID